MIGNFKTKTPRSKRYMTFVRTQPCCACGSTQDIESHHVKGSDTANLGMGIKVSDFRCVPLCPMCHGELHATSVERFSAKYHIDFSFKRLWCLTAYLVEMGHENPWTVILGALEAEAMCMEGGPSA